MNHISHKFGSADQYWSSKDGYAPNWYSFCADVISKRVTNNPKQTVSGWAMSTYCNLPVAHLLEIGCLSGDKLVQFIHGGLALQGTGIDIAAGAIERGRKKYGSAVQLIVGDLNKPELPPATFDVISSNGVLHHIANLEISAQALYDSLRPGGTLIASEFTGPQRYAYSTKEVMAINEGIAMLPTELRGERFDPIQLLPKLNADPSESIRTRDIGSVLAATFDDVISKPYGGNVLMRALTPKFFAAFYPGNPNHIVAINNLIEYDEKISSMMPSHHHVYVARKKKW